LYAYTADALQYLEWAEELEGELRAWTVDEEGMCIGLQPEEGVVADLELPLCAMLVSVRLDSRLSSQEMVLEQLQYTFTFLRHLLDGRCRLDAQIGQRAEVRLHAI
jgi:hypothetical protein